MRHGIHHGPLMNLLEQLRKNSTWKEISGYKNDKRMKSEELILRFFALSENWRTYQKPLSGFLSNYSERNQNLEKGRIEELKNNFQNTIEIANKLFGKLAFRTFDKDQKNPKFNAALFDAQMVAIFELDLKDSDIKRLKENDLLKKTAKLLEEDKFTKLISQSTTDKNSVINRIRLFQDFLKKLL